MATLRRRANSKGSEPQEQTQAPAGADASNTNAATKSKTKSAFPFKKIGKSDSTQTQSISYEDVENLTTVTPKTSKQGMKRRSSSMIGSKPASDKQQTAATKSNRGRRPSHQPAHHKPSANPVQKKSRISYPKSVMTVDHYKPEVGMFETHKASLVQIVKDACSAEHQALKQYFDEHGDRHHIFAHLEAILNEVPAAVKQDTPDDVHLHTEQDEPLSVQMQQLQDSLLRKQQQEARLRSWLHDEESFMQQFHINMRIPEHIRANNTVTAIAPELAQASGAFSSGLRNMQTRVSEIFEGTSRMMSTMASASASQNELYEAFKQIRTSVENKHVSSKEAIRALTGLLPSAGDP